MFGKRGSYITDYAALFVAVAVAFGVVRLFMTRAIEGRMHDFMMSSGFDKQEAGDIQSEILENRPKVDSQHIVKQSNRSLVIKDKKILTVEEDHSTINAVVDSAVKIDSIAK